MVEAALLAAGEGRRLIPITNHYPKPLLPIVSVPLLEHILYSLKEQDIKKVCINVCHLKAHLIDFLKEHRFGIEIAISEEEEILGTGGGIGKMRSDIASDDFVVHNGDIVTNIQFAEAFTFHLEKKAMATLVVEKREGSQDVLLGEEGRIVDIAGRLGREGSPFGFTGIAILNKAVFDFLPESEFADMVDTYAAMMKEGEALYGFESKGHHWFDIGTKEKYLLVHRNILIGRFRPFKSIPHTDTAIYVGDNSRVSDKAHLSGFVSIGKNCSVDDGIYLQNCVLFDGTHLADEGTYCGKVFSPEFVV